VKIEKLTPEQADLPIIGEKKGIMDLPIIGEKKGMRPVPVFSARELASIELALQGLIKNFALGGSTGNAEADELIGGAAETAHAKIYEALVILNGGDDAAE